MVWTFVLWRLQKVNHGHDRLADQYISLILASATYLSGALLVEYKLIRHLFTPGF